jgi:hypothetical protein
MLAFGSWTGLISLWIFSLQILMDGIEFSDMSSGDEEILKTYYRR